MANWASVEYIIEGSKEDLKTIQNALENPGEDGKSNWIGDVLITLGYSEEELEKYSLRGSLVDVRDLLETDDHIAFWTEEAWGLSDLAQLLEDIFPDIVVYWYVEEPAMSIYETNDSEGKYFPAKYIVKYYEDGEIIEYYYPESDEELFELTSELTNGEVIDFPSLEKFNENDSTYFIVNDVMIIP